MHTLSNPSKASTWALTLLRVTLGVILAVHGWAKLSDVSGTAQSFSSMGLPLPTLMVYLAVAGELLGGVGLILGLVARVAALGPVCTMAVAIITVHWSHGLLAKNGGMEYPLVLLVASAFFAVHGAGALSLDAWFANPRRRQQRLFRRQGARLVRRAA